MKKVLLIGLVVVVVGVAVVFVVWSLRAPDVDEPVIQDAQAVVEKALEPQKASPEPVTLAPLEFEAIPPTEQPAPGEEAAADAPDSTPAPSRDGVRMTPGQVFAVINGAPLIAEQLIPPSKFKRDKPMVLSKDVLTEVLDRSISRELILQEAVAQDLELDDRERKQLEDMYRHLTSNPLNLQGGATLRELNALGNVDDASFHVRDKAARLLQNAFLRQAGEQDTLDARMALRDSLWDKATIEVVDTTGGASTAQ